MITFSQTRLHLWPSHFYQLSVKVSGWTVTPQLRQNRRHSVLTGLILTAQCDIESTLIHCAKLTSICLINIT